MVQAVTGSLTILNAHTGPQVYWNGELVPHIGLRVESDGTTNKVTLKVAEDPVLAEMQAAGIVIKREIPV